MTVPGGVPNLPAGALTAETLASRLHDISPEAMRGRVTQLIPNIFNSSLGGNPASDYSLLGILAQMWASFNSAIANADPADITGPEDLPALLTLFIEDLPIVGELISLTKSIISGDFNPADVVPTIVNMFNHLGRMLGLDPDFNLTATVEQIGSTIEQIAAGIDQALRDMLTGIVNATPTDVDNWVLGVLTGSSPLDALNLFNIAPVSVIPTLDQLLGTLTAGQVPSLDSLLGMLTPGQIPDLDELFGTLTAIQVPTLDSLLGTLTAGQIPALPQSKIVDLATDLATKLGLGSPLDALNLFNLIPTNLLGHVPVSIIGDTAANLLTNPLFENLESIVSSVWAWDPTTSHSAVGGSAKVTAGGTAKELLSNVIPVSAGQTLTVSTWLKYSGLTGSGTPLQLGLTGYLNGAATAQPTLASVGLVPPTSDWRQLSATWTVPNNVDAVRLRLTVATTATAGTIWWDDGNLTKTGTLLPRLVGGTTGATLVDDLAKHTNDITANANAIIDRALKGDLTALQQALDPSGTLTNIQNRLNGFLTGSSPLNGSNINTGSITDNYLPGVKTSIDNIVRNLFNIGGSGYTHTDSADALAHVADTLGGISAQVNQLMAAQTAGVTGGDDFERTASSLGANWSVTYPYGTGPTVSCNGHNAVFNRSGTANRLAVCRNLTITTYGDFQVIRITLDGKAEKDTFGGNKACNDVLGRMSTDNLNYVRFRIGGGEAWLTRVVAGAEQDMNHITYTGADPGPGSTLTLICGTGGNARYFSGRHNGTTIIEEAEVGTASMLGAAYRQCGFGGLWQGYPLGQSAPGAVRQWTGGDQ